MNERYLSLSDAESYTGKSRSSLRRFVEAITKPENHPDRRFIQPTIEQVAELHAANHPFSWKISQDLLDRAFTKEGTASSNQSDIVQSTTINQMISLFEQTISMLNTELAEKNKQINEFQQRQRETNILLQQTTEKLVLLSDGTKRRPTSTDDSITIHSATANEFRSEEDSAEEGSESSETWESRPSERKTTASSAKKRNTTPKKPARKTLWQRLQTKLF